MESILELAVSPMKVVLNRSRRKYILVCLVLAAEGNLSGSCARPRNHKDVRNITTTCISRGRLSDSIDDDSTRQSSSPRPPPLPISDVS